MAGCYQAYPEYTKSEVDWIGDIPEHWGVKRLKFIFNIKKRIAGQLGFDVLSITQKGIVVKDTESGDGQLSMDYSKYQQVFESDFAMNHMDLLTGYVDISSFDGVTSPDYRVFSLTDISTFYARYYLYLLQMCYKQKIFFPLGQGSAHLGRWRLPTEAFNEVEYPHPNFAEQKIIANFLDHETAKIDTLITKQEKLIELLKEKRQAVISHAVTKGLNPDVPMKDSGVDWLGEVPEHWGKIAFKQVIKTRKGVAFSTSDFCDSGIRVVKASDIKQLSLNQSDVFLPKDFITKYPKAYLTQGNIILSTVGSTPDVKNSAVGQIAIVPKELDKTLLNQNTVVFDPIGNAIDRNYLFFVLQTRAYRDHLDLHAHGTANQASLNVADMLDFKCFTPSTDEQKLIAMYLYKFLDTVSNLETKAVNAIQLMKERKTALISAAVTGKIDVRDWDVQGDQK